MKEKIENEETQMMDFEDFIGFYILRTLDCWRLDMDYMIGWIAYVAQLGNIGAWSTGPRRQRILVRRWNKNIWHKDWTGRFHCLEGFLAF